MKITSWNIQHGQVYSPGQVIDRTAEIKRTLTSLNPDVLLIQEVDHLDERSNREQQTREFAEIIDAPYWAFAPSVWRKDDSWLDWPMGTSENFPALITASSTTSEPCYGIGIASRIPVIKWERKELPKALMGWWLPTTIDGVTRKYWVKDHARTALAAYLEDGTGKHSKPMKMTFNATRHQFKDSECGMYCLYFHRSCLMEIPMQERIPDDVINGFRQLLFRVPKIEGGIS